MKDVFSLDEIPNGYIDSKLFPAHKQILQKMAYKSEIPSVRFLSKPKNKRGSIFIDITIADITIKAILTKKAQNKLNISTKKNKKFKAIVEQPTHDCSPEKLVKDILLVLEIINAKLDAQTKKLDALDAKVEHLLNELM